MPHSSEPASGTRPVFISFASEDLELANRILASLEAHGIRCWIAHRDIGLAESYPAAIGAALGSSGAVLLLLTEHSNRSPHVRREVEMAFNARTPILPVRMSGILPSDDLQYFLSTTQWLDAGPTFDDDEAARLRDVLRRLLDRKGGGDGSRLAAGTRRRVATAATVSAAGVTLVLVLFAIWTRGDRVPAAGRAAPAGTTAAAGERTSAAAADAGPRTASNALDGAAYVWIPPGDFVMGCSAGDGDCEDDERPAHRVSIARGFWLGQTEVTAGQYNRRPSGPAIPAEAGELPAFGVSWAEARQYCAAVGGRLPTESEWEYAARAGTTGRFYADPADIAWYGGNSGERPQPVGRKAPNAFRLHDMLGNVAEWVRDRYYDAYDDSGEATGVEEPLASNAFGVVRGGHWASEARGLRVSRRLEMWPDAADPILGFRCARDTL